MYNYKSGLRVTTILLFCSFYNVSYAGLFDWLAKSTVDEKSDAIVKDQRACIDYIEIHAPFSVRTAEITNPKDEHLTKREVDSAVKQAYKDCKKAFRTSLYAIEGKEYKIATNYKCDLIDSNISSSDKPGNLVTVNFMQIQRAELIPYEKIVKSYEFEDQGKKVLHADLRSESWAIHDPNMPSVAVLSAKLEADCSKLGGTTQAASVQLNHNYSERWLEAECASTDGFYSYPDMEKGLVLLKCEEDLQAKYGDRLLTAYCNMNHDIPKYSINKVKVEISENFNLAIKKDDKEKKEKKEKFECIQAERCIKVKDKYSKSETEAIEALYSKCNAKDVVNAVSDKSINNANGAKPTGDEKDKPSSTSGPTALQK